MTTIAITKHAGVLTIAADTVAVDSMGYAIPASRKIWKQPGAAGHVVFGCAGNAGISTIVQRHLKVSWQDLPDRGTSDDTWDEWAAAIAQACAELCANASPPSLEDGGVDGNLILGAGARFWALATHAVVPVYRASDHYATGSGKPYAIGWLAARPGDVNGAVRCAARWDTNTGIGVDGPHVLTAAALP